MFSGPDPQKGPCQTQAGAAPTASNQPSMFLCTTTPDHSKPKAGLDRLNMYFMDAKKADVAKLHEEICGEHEIVKTMLGISQPDSKVETPVSTTVAKPTQTGYMKEVIKPLETPGGLLNECLEGQVQLNIPEEELPTLPIEGSCDQGLTQMEKTPTIALDSTSIKTKEDKANPDQSEETTSEQPNLKEQQENEQRKDKEQRLKAPESLPEMGQCQEKEPITETEKDIEPEQPPETEKLPETKQLLETEKLQDLEPQPIEEQTHTATAEKPLAAGQPPVRQQQVPTVQPQLKPQPKLGAEIHPGQPLGQKTKGPLKSPELDKSVLDSSAEVFSGFMSGFKMFSGPTAPSKPATSSFFSAQQSSFFKSSPCPAPQPQQKGSFFNLPTNLPTESLKGDLFGIFKGPEPPKQAETKASPTTKPQSGVQVQKMGPNDTTVPAVGVRDPSKAPGEMTAISKSDVDDKTKLETVGPAAKTGHERSIGDEIKTLSEKKSDTSEPSVPNDGVLSVEAEQKPEVSKTISEVTQDSGDLNKTTNYVAAEDTEKSTGEDFPSTLETDTLLTFAPGKESRPPDVTVLPQIDVFQEDPKLIISDPKGDGMVKAGLPLDTLKETPSTGKQLSAAESSPPAKSMFEIPSSSSPSFGFLSGTADSGYLFCSPPTVRKGTQAPQVETGGFLSGFKTFSASLFQEEKTTAGKEDPSAALVLGEKLGFLWQTPEVPKPQSPPPFVPQPEAKDIESSEAEANDAPKTECDQSEQDSEETEGADSSGTDEPSEVSLEKFQSSDICKDSHKVTKQASADIVEDGTLSVSSVKPKVQFSLPETDKSKPSTDSKDEKSLSEPLTPADSSAGPQQDKQSKQDLEKRPVAA